MFKQMDEEKFIFISSNIDSWHSYHNLGRGIIICIYLVDMSSM